MKGNFTKRKIQRFCKRRHDKDKVGRTSNGACKECEWITYTIRFPGKGKGHSLCPHGRDSRNDLGACTPCNNVAVRKCNWKKWGILNKNGVPFTLDDYEEAMTTQEDRCAFPTCRKHISEIDTAFSVDHDHSSKRFRGLLCTECNRKVVADHTVESAEALLRYLSMSALS